MDTDICLRRGVWGKVELRKRMWFSTEVGRDVLCEGFLTVCVLGGGV